jgi:L-asparaginase
MIGTGGTIACKQSEKGLSPVITTQELLSYVPGYTEFCSADSIQVMNIDSTNMHPKHWLEIAQTIEKKYAEYDGFVVTHGTDTMAYTAAALSYLIQNSGKPVIVTGAQKPINMENTDARVNLLDSLELASCDKTYGVNIVFDGKLIAGTRDGRNGQKAIMLFQVSIFRISQRCRTGI